MFDTGLDKDSNRPTSHADNMDVYLIVMLCARFGMISGDTDRSMPSSYNSPEASGPHVITLIYDLENRVRILEDVRAEDVRRMRDMQSEIDELKSDNYRLQQLSFDRHGDVTPVRSDIDKAPSGNRHGGVTPVRSDIDKAPSGNRHGDDELGSKTVKNSQKPVHKYVNNNTIRVLTAQNGDEPGRNIPDVPPSRAKTNRSLFRRRRGTEHSIPMHIGYTRVGSTATVAFHAILGTDVLAPAVNHEIVFDQVITNNGDLYSQHTGTFTCQQPGTYVFSWSICTYSSIFLDSHLLRNGAIMGSIVSTNENHSNTGSGSVVIQLGSGDDVWVRVGNHGNGANIYGTWSMFSGFKLN